MIFIWNKFSLKFPKKSEGRKLKKNNSSCILKDRWQFWLNSWSELKNKNLTSQTKNRFFFSTKKIDFFPKRKMEKNACLKWMKQIFQSLEKKFLFPIYFSKFRLDSWNCVIKIKGKKIFFNTHRHRHHRLFIAIINDDEENRIENWEEKN